MHRKSVAQLAIKRLLAYTIPPSASLVQFPIVLIWYRRFVPNFVSDESVAGERRCQYKELEPEESGGSD